MDAERNTNREIDWSVGPEVVIAIQRGDHFYEVETGLRGALIIERRPPQFVIAFKDDVSAEEMARIITGHIKNELF
jgi:hypothetical protein